MTDTTSIGTRVQVYSTDMKDDLGLGTYIGELEINLKVGGSLRTSWIFLDSGKGIFGLECWWQEVQDVPSYQPVEVILSTNVRAFRNVRATQLVRTDEQLAAGEKILIEQVATMFYDHRNQVAASFTRNGDILWIIISEMEPVSHYVDGNTVPISIVQH